MTRSGSGETKEPLVLTLARELRALAQTGLAFSEDRFDRERYERVRMIAAELTATATGLAVDALHEAFALGTGYATPKVDVRAAAFRDGRVLLVQERSDGRWTLPGGWADVNQTPTEAALRELREESGFEGRVLKLAAVHDYRTRNPGRHLDSIYKLFFICELIGGEARPSIETSAVEFFPADALPPLSAGRTTGAQIERMFAHAARPMLPTEFD
jgi:ADP-ribose pyrophosphatase YjhB (NUDIX family)